MANKLQTVMHTCYCF